MRPGVGYMIGRNKKVYDRLSENNSKSKLLEITVSMGLILLQEGKYAAALVAAKQYLGAYRISLYQSKKTFFSVLVADIFGTNSLELIPAYLLIAETSIGLNKLREAEQQLQKGNHQTHFNQTHR